MDLITATFAQLKAVLEMMESLESLMFQGSKSYYSENDRFLNSEILRLRERSLLFNGLFSALFFLAFSPWIQQGPDGWSHPLPPMVGTTPGLRERYYKPTTKFF